MAAPPVEIPCEPWTTPEEVAACCGGLDPAFDLTGSIAFASAVLYRLSGRQFPGECERTVWPCLTGCPCGGCDISWGYGGYPYSYPSFPYRDINGDWFNAWCCSGECEVECFRLPQSVNSVSEIRIDDTVLDPLTYVVKAYRDVCRIDGGVWPTGNKPLWEPGPGVWTITYNYGKLVPLDGRLAASIFACQLALARCGGESCLPARLKEISRQGVDMAFADPMEFLDKGQVGIYEVDLWLRSVNPQGIRRRSRMHRPDAGRTNSTRTTPPTAPGP